MQLSLVDILDKLAANHITQVFIRVRGNLEVRISIGIGRPADWADWDGVKYNDERITFAEFNKRLTYYNSLGEWRVEVSGRSVFCNLNNEL